MALKCPGNWSSSLPGTQVPHLLCCVLGLVTALLWAVGISAIPVDRNYPPCGGLLVGQRKELWGVC